MKVPALFIGATLLLWGFETGNLLLGCLLAMALESSWLTPKRWDLADSDFVGISDFSSVIFLSSVGLILLNTEATQFMRNLSLWLPVILIPLILAQLYSKNDTIIIGTRIGRKRAQPYAHKPLDFKPVYCAICVFSAAIANSRSPYFFPVILGLLTWILFVNRGKGFSSAYFMVLILITASLGSFSAHLAVTTHTYLKQHMHHLVHDYYWAKYSDPFQTHVSFGTFKKHKNSAKIILRLTTNGTTPLLLKQVSYDLYTKNQWSSNRSFAYLPVGKSGWQLMPPPENKGYTAKLELYLPREQGILPYPSGSYLVQGENLFELEQNSVGTIKIKDAASLVDYRVSYTPGSSKEDDIPTKRNLQIPSEEDSVLTTVANNLELPRSSKQESLLVIKDFFQENFEYSLVLSKIGKEETRLGNFLFDEQKGYCEMFATATTLLLRKANIPSRYATGYSVGEYSTFEKKYIVRQRHAHAWVEAYFEGRWITVDTTPSVWPEVDSQEASFFEPLLDFISFCKLHFDYFRIKTEQRYKIALSVLIIILTTFLGFRLYRRLKPKEPETIMTPDHKTFEVITTPFHLIENVLSTLGRGRYKGEPFMHWADRINKQTNIDMVFLERLYSQHQKLRFDPRQENAEETIHLQRGVDQWLSSFTLLTQDPPKK